MRIEIIQSPSKGTMDMIINRIGNRFNQYEINTDALGLIQGSVVDMICATDIAEKAANIKTFDIRGNCPQNAIMVAIFGDIASVETAVSAIRLYLEKRKDYVSSKIN